MPKARGRAGTSAQVSRLPQLRRLPPHLAWKGRIPGTAGQSPTEEGPFPLEPDLPRRLHLHSPREDSGSLGTGRRDAMS